jgi:galactose mutarotase-like enzyme
MRNTIGLYTKDIELEVKLLGAEMISLKNSAKKNLLWEKDENHWNRIAPNLFPIVGKLKSDTYRFGEKKYSMKQHGFARDLEYEVCANKVNKLELVLRQTSETLAQYPFYFCFSVEYELVGNKIYVTYKTTNTGKETMPYSVGGHPGFSINLPINQFQLNFHRPFIVDRWIIKEGHYTGESEKMEVQRILKLKDDLFAHDAIVFKNPPFTKVTLENIYSEKIATLGSDNWDAVGFWTKPGAPFFCIEPWWGWADYHDSSGNLLEKSGIHFLEPGQSEKLTYYIEVH